MIVRQLEPGRHPQDPRERLLGVGPMLAPLCGISDSSFRRVCRRLGAGLLFTEMISAEGVVRSAGGCWRMLGFHAEELPLYAQLSTASPDFMAEAAVIVAELGVTGINLNMGCPARKVVKGDKGAGLMKNPAAAAQVVRRTVDAVKLPVTVKMRAGWDESCVNALELGLQVQEAGAAAVILHPRTRKQAYAGKADWSLISKLREALEIPVVGNGDILAGADAVRMVRETGCERVMIGRGCFGNPWLFREAKAALEGHPAPPRPGPREILEVIEAQLRFGLEEKREIVVARQMRKHVLWYSRGLPHSTDFRNRVVRLDRVADQLDVCREYFLAAAEREERG